MVEFGFLSLVFKPPLGFLFFALIGAARAPLLRMLFPHPSGQRPDQAQFDGETRSPAVESVPLHRKDFGRVSWLCDRPRNTAEARRR
jgi:hypothetical protein